MASARRVFAFRWPLHQGSITKVEALCAALYNLFTHIELYLFVANLPEMHLYLINVSGFAWKLLCCWEHFPLGENLNFQFESCSHLSDLSVCPKSLEWNIFNYASESNWTTQRYYLYFCPSPFNNVLISSIKSLLTIFLSQEYQSHFKLPHQYLQPHLPSVS